MDRKDDESSFGEKAFEILSQSAISQCSQVKLDKRPNHSFLSTAWVKDKQNVKCWVIQIDDAILSSPP
jgi:hypothetical protein